MLAGAASGMQGLSVHFQALAGLTCKTRTRFEEVSNHIRRDKRHHSILKSDGSHIRSLTAEHSGLATELASANLCDFTFHAILNDLKRDRAGHHEVDAFKIIALIK